MGSLDLFSKSKKLKKKETQKNSESIKPQSLYKFRVYKNSESLKIQSL